ncbi:hypothetical protein Pth03_61590 [Planotetraspora thailandica]|uniref:Uncharacterized protein n=1 Tax=Planotetraspora thailandica TaxID=487172 RepID=A0A8J3XYR1_9ACTN|nr:hypothetical protein [Planotetraspora thailandica]GII57770.1 hypothetical protein Pth03_61590 [Planotetraspora thailandica]
MTTFPALPLRRADAPSDPVRVNDMTSPATSPATSPDRGQAARTPQPARPSHNAICLGGPCHGMLTRVEQDIGLLTVPVPRRSPEEPDSTASYRVTRERVHHPSSAEPFVALYWADPPAGTCSCGCSRFDAGPGR